MIELMELLIIINLIGILFLIIPLWMFLNVGFDLMRNELKRRTQK